MLLPHRIASVGALLWLSAASAPAQLTMRVTGIPAATPPNATLYLAGSFNGWNPGAAEYALRRVGDQHVVTLPASVRGVIEFKFTLGSWERVETDAAGGDVANRTFTVPAGATEHHVTIAGWRSGAAPKRASSATRSVSIIDTAFAMPQLQRTRRIWLYLPPDYATSSKRYPVIYMHDGQNVFDAATSFAGEWGVDETLDSLHATGDWGAIVVAVDHAGGQRINEYSPWPTRFGNGDGAAYVDFLVRTLKPWIDARYRTMPGRLHTAIAGSSMGGLISFYAALKHPDVFGRAGIFSPAFWIAPAAYDFAARYQPSLPDQRFYIISGAQEVAAGEQAGVYQRDQQRMVEKLVSTGIKAESELIARIAADGTHSEWFWRREFPAAYRFLFNRK
jgi:predicted alpha/beta superfamily hydrolase